MPRGTRVNLVVVISLVTVPNVIERSLADAIQILRAAGLGYEIGEGYSQRYSVSSQSPQAGTKVRRGTRVRLVFPYPG